MVVLKNCFARQLKDKKFVPDINSLGIVDNQLSFLSSLSDKTYGLKCDPVAEFFKLHFRTAKTSLARHLYYIFNELVFDNQLPKFMPLKWSGKLKTASGITTTKFEADPEGNAIFIAYITLSKKIITTAERLRDTLVHEMCHAAVWIINHASDSHGTLWKLWSLKARLALPELPAITRCHSYEINYKYIYKCKDCGYRIGRSRPSNKLLERSLCGYCGGRFRLCEDEQKE
ncbi:hypothetical protein O3M35_009681 [Rhynocoris fuscipes]|uniref:SprT-like domain-containing protein n=1 Tax=Rhynocoris fuscipes TaxID=488301 RepID=A0AAW1DAU0_9HEMI